VRGKPRRSVNLTIDEGGRNANQGGTAGNIHLVPVTILLLQGRDVFVFSAIYIANFKFKEESLL
jgi:hypothetical protein